MERKAILFQVGSSKEKVKKLISLTHSSIDHKVKLLLRTKDLASANYLDRLLWSYPVHTFLPHAIATAPSKEMICITYLDCNPNGASRICNLTEDAILDPSYTLVYDFDDQSSPEKKALSEEKIAKYKSAKLTIASF